MIEDTETLLSSDFSDNVFNTQESFENAEVVLLPTEEPNIEAETLKVVSFDLIPSGFELNFNKQIDESLFNLYELDNVQADLIVTDALDAFIDGSVVFNDDFSGLSFIQTGEQLQPGDYTLTLKSGDNGIIDIDGGLLDGNDDGTVGDDYTIEFTIENLDRVLNLSDLVATSGQDLQSEQLSVSIDDGSEITSLALELKYDPNLLDINTIELIEDLPEDWNIETNFSSSGTANITLTGNTPLTSGEQKLIQILGNISETATYGTSQILTVDNIILNDGEISGLGDSAIHQVALLGDASGDETYNPTDSYLISQLSAGLINNFPAYPHINPSIIVELNGDNTISAFDAYITTRDNLDYIPPTITITNPISTNSPDLTSFLDPLVNDGDKITGGADDADSDIAEVTYRFNENSEIVIPVNENGEFDLELDLTQVKNSFSTINLTVTDQAGNTNSSEIVVVVPITTPSGLQYADARVGSGATPSTGDRVTVNYTGYFENGTIFDSSQESNTPFSFPLGQGRVIQGWEEGVASMNVGTVRRLYIPSELAYGERGVPGTIPPNTLLIFDVELLSIG